jgi:hypothetical protein
MSSVDIVSAIKERGLRNVTGNTPEATVGAQIYSSIKKDGEFSPFVQKSPNVFSFKKKTKVNGDVAKNKDDINTAKERSYSKITNNKMPLTYDDPLTAVFLRTLAWENHEADREPLVKELVANQVQTAREDLGLTINKGGAPHNFIQSLRGLKKPLISCDPTKPLEKGWGDKEAWRLYYAPSHRFVRMLSFNPIKLLLFPPKTEKSAPFQICLKLRSPASPIIYWTVRRV